jgi:hypothetical protein
MARWRFEAGSAFSMAARLASTPSARPPRESVRWRRPPNFQAPLILNTTIASLANSSLVYTPLNVIGGSVDFEPPGTYAWSIGVQRDLGKGFILDASYVANVAHNLWNVGGTTATLGPNNTNVNVNTGVDFNAVAPLTTWTPTANNRQPGPVRQYLDPTSANGGTGAFYSTNLIRALAGGYQGWGAINTFTQIGASNYNAPKSNSTSALVDASNSAETIPGRRLFFTPVTNGRQTNSTRT